jgi:hypothetical protein
MVNGKLAYASLLSLAVLACGGPAEDETGFGSVAQELSSCAQYYVEFVNSNAYFAQSNRWNSTAAMCVNVSGTSIAVTSSQLNNATNGSPGAYPSLVKGRHYANKTSGWTAKKVSAITSASSSLNITTASGVWNASWDVWFDPNQDPTGAAQIELMVWLKKNGSIQPIGSKVTTASIGGVSYDVWHGGNVTSYVRTSGTNSASINIKSFTSDMAARGWLNQSYYLTSIQGGFEIWQQGAGLKVNSFSASVS